MQMNALAIGREQLCLEALQQEVVTRSPGQTSLPLSVLGEDVYGGLKENGFQREWHYEEAF